MEVLNAHVLKNYLGRLSHMGVMQSTEKGYQGVEATGLSEQLWLNTITATLNGLGNW